MKIHDRFNKYIRHSIKNKTTRSYGLLERFLAMQRAKIANRFISDRHRAGRVLDIGCGSFPIFLLTTKFMEKFGIEKDIASMLNAPHNKFSKLNIVNYDIEKGSAIPFDENFMDAVTMLAVFEHVEGSVWQASLTEVRRILKPGGICILTVPATWSDWLLRFMASFKLISRIEIDDHKTNFSTSSIISILKKSGFKNMRSGYFEVFLNRWFIGEK
jgi:ubiquinone/menaquinone biosynthesis C-methylase UbiE